MKQLFTILFASLLMVACNNPEGTKPAPKIEDVAYFEWAGQDYWVMQYDTTATEQQIKEHAKKFTNIKKWSCVFFYPNTEDNSLFAKEKFNRDDLLATVKKFKPSYTFYKAANDTVVLAANDLLKIDTTVNNH